jgi:hypothetical protein
MQHLKEYNDSSLNEDNGLNNIPPFLKKAGATKAIGPHSPGAWLAGGQKKLSNNCWSIQLKSPFERGEKITLYFYPDKRFIFSKGIGGGSKFEGKWETGTSDDVFVFGDDRTNKKLTGVKMQFTLFGGVQTLD